MTCPADRVVRHCRVLLAPGPSVLGSEEMINFAIKDSSARVEGFLGDADAEVVKRGLLLSGFKLSGTGKSPRRLVCTKDNLDPQFRDLLLTNAAQRSGQPVDSLLVNLYPLNSEDDPHDYGMRAHCDQIPGCVRLALRLLIVPHGTWVEKKLESKTILTIAGHDYCRKIVVSRTDSGLALGDVEHGSRAHPGIGCVLKHEVPAHDEGTLVVSVIHTWDVPFSQQATFLQNLRDQCAAVGDKFPVMQVTSAEVETLSYSNPAFARCCLADLNAQAGENGRAKMTRARTAVATGSASSAQQTSVRKEVEGGTTGRAEMTRARTAVATGSASSAQQTSVRKEVEGGTTGRAEMTRARTAVATGSASSAQQTSVRKQDEGAQLGGDRAHEAAVKRFDEVHLGEIQDAVRKSEFGRLRAVMKSIGRGTGGKISLCLQRMIEAFQHGEHLVARKHIARDSRTRD